MPVQSSRYLVLVPTLLVCACAASRPPAAAPREIPAAVAPTVPTPASHLGYEVGTDRRLADWPEITAYMEKLARSSARVRVDTLGVTTLGRPFVMLTISAPATLGRLDEYRDIQRRLADPRLVRDSADAAALIGAGKTVVLITAAIHSTEVGAFMAPLNIAYRLAASNDPTVREILANTIVLLVPSLNPDGVDLVVDWYERTLGQPWEGASPPFLYHHYTGHDNNRDWYFFSQKETQLAVEHAHNAWHPHIVHDIHQQGSEGSRFFIPPYIDPIEPNVDPILVEGVNQLGAYMAWRMGQAGFTGISINATYDAWTPARAYQHYHGGVRILSETASARMATPIALPFDSLEQGRNFHAREQSWNFPDPWPGGEWRLRDIVAYQEAGAMALLENAAKNREAWLRSFLAIGRRAVARDEPSAIGRWRDWPNSWVIANDPGTEDAVQELLRVLTTGGVEVRRAPTAFEAFVDDASARAQFPAGSYVIPMQQPYAAFAQALLEKQEYPDLRVYPGGPPRRPYDVTAHTLPLLLGVRAVPASGFGSMGGLTDVDPVRTVRRVAPGLTRGTGDAPRIAIYQSYDPSMDEGWTRWVLDAYDIPFDTLHDAQVRAGNLRARFDAIVLPSQPAREIRAGRAAGSVPPEYAGGLGETGAAALREFVRAGGTLVALEEASEYAIELLGLPLSLVNDDLPPADFYIPGSILRLELDTTSAIARGMPERSIAWFGSSSFAFEPGSTDARVRIIGRYGRGETLLSGWALGEERIAGAGALVVAEVGSGRAVLFGFQPQYRGQPRATFPLLFNALRTSANGR